MYIGLTLSLTRKSNEYETLLRDRNKIPRSEIDAHRDRMDKLAQEMQEIRKKIALITPRK